jgi:hypothetical protein
MNGFNLNATILNVLAPNSVLDMRGGTLSYVTVLSMDGTVRFQELTMGEIYLWNSRILWYYSNSKSGSYYDLLFSGASGIYTMASDIDVANTLKVTNGSVILQSGLTLSVENAVTVASPGTLTWKTMPLCYNHFIKGKFWKCNREKE